MTTTAARLDVTRVRMAEYAVGSEPMRSNGLGSCVAVALVDPGASVGGLAHVMLPDSDCREGEPPAKFADTAIPHLAREVVASGGRRLRLRAKVVGGSDLFEFSGVGERIGERNAECVRRALVEASIPVDGSDTGGDYGRTVTLEPRTGTVRIETAGGGELTL